MKPSPCPPRRQRGAALLTAMIIVTLVATLASAMIWQQWRSVQVEAAERARAQSAWILAGALDFAKMILFEQKNNSVVALTDPWATPLAEARISTFLAVDKSNADDGPEAFLSGNMEDAQARFNLAAVAPGGKIDPAALAILQRLCQGVNIDASIAQRIATGLAAATSPTNAGAPLLPATVAQLNWLGVDDASIQALKPYIVLIQQNGALTNTPINVNTASSQVLAAVANTDPSTAEHLAQIRQRTPFSASGTFASQVPGFTALSADLQNALLARLAVSSSYFEVHSRLRLADRVLLERSLLFRAPSRVVTVIDRERTASLE